MVGSLSSNREHVICKTCGKSTRDAVLDRPVRCACTYRTEVLRTAAVGTSSLRDQFLMGGIGLGGEAGEVLDLLKKHIFHGATLNKESLIKELGDVRWYLEHLAITVGVTMEEIETTNVLKLRARYPSGFNTSDAERRQDETK